MKFCLLLIAVLTLTAGCKKKNSTIELSPGITEGQTFNETVLIDGHAYDGSSIKNCVFEDIDVDALQLRDVDDLCIENCVFKNIKENGIRFRNSGASNGVQIKNCTFTAIGSNGILAPEGHINTLIAGNKMVDIAQNNASSLAGAPHHGIYFQGRQVRIVENEIYNIINTQGNCISIRTSGTIARNRLYNATDHGISYFSDHPGFGETLLIENNIIYDNGKRAVNLASNGNTDNHINNAVIRFNTMVVNDKSCIATNEELTGVDMAIFGNILIRTDGADSYIFTTHAFTENMNLVGDSDIGFNDFTNRDLHLSSGSSAEGFATGITDFPTTDIDGEPRTADNLDAGADER